MVALITTKSVYHLILLLGAVPLALLLIGRPTRRQLILLLVLVLLPTSWYGKNRIQYGFFGASSWYGMGLWRTALFDQDGTVLDELYATGTLSPVVRVEAFAPPIEYRRLGYDQESQIPLLSGNDSHNINIPTISRDYRSSAVLLIKASPVQYLRNVITAYGNFATPSADFVHLADNRDRIRLHASVETAILGRPLVARLENALGSGYYGSLYFLLFSSRVVALRLPGDAQAEHPEHSATSPRRRGTAFHGSDHLLHDRDRMRDGAWREPALQVRDRAGLSRAQRDRLLPAVRSPA